jgi:hypothetical protein
MFIYGVIRRFSYKQACVILGIALVVQVIDTSSGYLPMRERNQASRGLNYENPSKSDFWEQAAKRYNNIRFFPLHSDPLPQTHWHVLAAYAAKYHLATNDVYLARLDQNKIATANRQFLQQLRNKNLDPQTLYVFEDAYIVNVRPFINRQKDYLAKIDGFLSVLALNYKTCADCPLDDSEKVVDTLSIEPALGQRIAFTNTGIGRSMVGWGWAKPESWGMWAEDRTAVLSMVLPKHAHIAVFEWNALVSQKHPTQRVKVLINDEFEQLFTLAQEHDNHTKLLLPPQLRGQYIQLEFNFLDAERSVSLLGVTFY